MSANPLPQGHVLSLGRALSLFFGTIVRQLIFVGSAGIQQDGPGDFFTGIAKLTGYFMRANPSHTLPGNPIRTDRLKAPYFGEVIGSHLRHCRVRSIGSPSAFGL